MLMIKMMMMTKTMLMMTKIVMMMMMLTKWCNIPVKVTILKGNSLKSVDSSEDCSAVEVEPLMLI